MFPSCFCRSLCRFVFDDMDRIISVLQGGEAEVAFTRFELIGVPIVREWVLNSGLTYALEVASEGALRIAAPHCSRLPSGRLYIAIGFAFGLCASGCAFCWEYQQPKWSYSCH
jgi:hypothetical protein